MGMNYRRTNVLLVAAVTLSLALIVRYTLLLGDVLSSTSV